jgi:hypothetical protein
MAVPHPCGIAPRNRSTPPPHPMHFGPNKERVRQGIHPYRGARDGGGIFLWQHYGILMRD